MRRFVLRLALAMGRTAGELLDTMTSAELAEWLAFATIEPFGGPTEDIRLGTLCSATTAPWGGKMKPDEWFQWCPPEPSGTWRDIRAGFVAAAAGRKGG